MDKRADTQRPEQASLPLELDDAGIDTPGQVYAGQVDGVQVGGDQVDGVQVGGDHGGGDQVDGVQVGGGHGDDAVGQDVVAGEDAPIGFALTARARRAVAPGSLPDLAVVPSSEPASEPGSLDGPRDTRPARARALHRAGTSIDDIASQLGCDPLAVVAWIGEVERSGRGPRRPATASTPSSPGAVTGPAVSVPDASGGGTGTATLAASDDEVADHLARAQAAEEARVRLASDAGFAADVGLLAALVVVDRYAVTLTSRDARLVARAIGALRRTGDEVDRRVRVVLRVPSGAAGDLVRHRAASELGVAVEQVSWTRRRTIDPSEEIDYLLRVAEPIVASTVSGWIDALLEPAPADLDLAF